MPRRATPTLTAAIAEYQETRATYVAKTTLANEWSQLRRFRDALGETTQVHTLTCRQVELWFAAEAKRQQPSSFNKARTRVKGFLDFCVRRGWVDRDLLGEVRPLRVVRRERMRLSVADLLDLPNHADNARDRAFIATACNTALRANELCSLRVKDVDLQDGWLTANISKSAKQDRRPITSELDAELRTWLAAYAEDAGELQADWYLFPQREPGAGRYIRTEEGTVRDFHIYGMLLPEKPLRNPAQLVQRAMARQGHHIEVGEGVHTLRRSVARCFFDMRVTAGQDGALRETSALLNHSSSQVTEVYLGLQGERLSRDDALKGQPFLSAMVSGENVTSISAAR